MKLMTKAAVADAEKAIQDAGDELAKSFEETMAGLEALIKGTTVDKDKEEKKTAEDAEALAKSIQAKADKDKKDKDEKAAETAEEMAKSLHAEKVPDAGGKEVEQLDAAEVIAEFKSAMANMIAKAVVSVRESIIGHMDAKLAEVRDGQVALAKSQLVNGKILKEAMHEVAVIGEQPRQRKSMLTVLDKSLSGGGGGGNDATPVISVEKVMAKAIELNKNHVIMPADVGVINHYVTGGHGIPRQFAHLFPASEISQ